MRGPEYEFEQTVVAELRRRHFLVAHFRPARTADGWRTPVAADGAGFPDLIAMRPGCPMIGLELKAEGGKPSKDQRDWIAAGQADGRLVTFLWPENWTTFIKHLDVLDREYPAPEWWAQTLIDRAWRTSMRRSKKVIQRQLGQQAASQSVVRRDDWPAVFKHGAKVYSYRGHTSSDGSICGYGPIIWDGAANRWRPGDRAKFRCFGAGDKILLKWKGMPTARKKEAGDGDEAGS